MKLRTRDLRLVVAIAAQGTQTAAAEQLHVSQPALSRQLSALERRLGFPLFQRSSAGMRATPAGQRLVEQAKPLLTRLGALEAEMDRLARGEAGEIRVTTQCYTCYRWLPEVLPGLREEFPGVDVRIVPEASTDPVGALLGGEIDLALAYDFDGKSEHLGAVPLFQDELVLLVPPDHPYASRDRVSAQDFADQHLLAYTDDPDDNWFWRTVLTPDGVAPGRVSGLRLTEGIVALVASGVGVAVLTRWTVAREVASEAVRAIPIGTGGVLRTWSAVALKETLERPYVQRFIALAGDGPAPLFEPESEPVRQAAAIRVLR